MLRLLAPWNEILRAEPSDSADTVGDKEGKELLPQTVPLRRKSKSHQIISAGALQLQLAASSYWVQCVFPSWVVSHFDWAYMASDKEPRQCWINPTTCWVFVTGMHGQQKAVGLPKTQEEVVGIMMIVDWDGSKAASEQTSGSMDVILKKKGYRQDMHGHMTFLSPPAQCLS